MFGRERAGDLDLCTGDRGLRLDLEVSHTLSSVRLACCRNSAVCVLLVVFVRRSLVEPSTVNLLLRALL
jgi:hypothetical protein